MPRSLLIVLLVWAAIYLPSLGTLEIKGEEGRRILPAVTMLETGNYLVPQVGSDPYYRKPPLVNWLVAASFKTFGVRNEWAARIPSALCVLAVAIAFVTVGRGSLGARGSQAAALIWMTSFGMIEKGRLIEIEALYVSLFGLAMICWLSAWEQRRSRWVTWTISWVFLGLGLLAKGPLHLLFFYAVVIAILWKTGELRTIWNRAHLLGLLLMLGIFAAWAVPCLLAMPADEVTHTWSRQFTGRLAGEDSTFTGWLMNIPRGLGYFLPWTLLLLVLKWPRFLRSARSLGTAHRAVATRREAASLQDESIAEGAARNHEGHSSELAACSHGPVGHVSGADTMNASHLTERFQTIASGLQWGVSLSFLLVSLLPGSLARYTMPLLVPATWLIAQQLTSGAFPLPHWLELRWLRALAPELRLPTLVAGAVCIAIALYSLLAIPHLKSRSKIRSIATQINAAAPAPEPLYAVDPEYQPFLFYVRDPIVYAGHVRDVPSNAHYLLVQRAKEAEAISSEQWRPAKAQPVLHLKDYRGKEVTLLKVQADE